MMLLYIKKREFMFKIFKKWREKGQTFVEYGVVIAVVACIAIAGLASAGNSINDKVTAMAGSTTESESTSAYWGVSDDNVLTLSTKPLSASEGSTDNGQVDLTGSGYVNSTWGNYADTITTVNIKDHMAPSNTACWFDSMWKLTSINNIQNLDTSMDTDMNHMFGYCQSFTSLDVSHFDTSKVINMKYMFYYCSELTSLDVSHFDTSKVTDMDGMFGYCQSLTSLSLNGFNTSKVTNMYGMFQNCESLTSLDVSHFDTSKVINMGYMFSDCSKLASLDTSNFVINAGTNTDGMYSNCPAHS